MTPFPSPSLEVQASLYWSFSCLVCTCNLTSFCVDSPSLASNLTQISFIVHVQIVPDLILDTPTAPVLLEKFTEQAKSDGCLPADYVPPAPTPAVGNQSSDGLASANGHQNGTSTA